MNTKTIIFSVCAVCLLLLAARPALAQNADTAELSKKLANPIANLISVPIEYNKDSNIGPSEDGEVKSIKFTPVVPFDVGEDWTMISRTIFSLVEQDLPDADIDTSGISDIALTLYFTPKEVGPSGTIWGVGPIILLDSASEESLGAGKYGLGPAAVALQQNGPWTYGGLTYYLKDIEGEGDGRDRVEQFFLQPFLSYQFEDGKTSITVQTEATRDLENDETLAFALVQYNRMFNWGSQIMQWRLGVRHWYEDGDGTGPDSTELNARITFLFPQ